jgi:hypothetical protein
MDPPLVPDACRFCSVENSFKTPVLRQRCYEKKNLCFPCWQACHSFTITEDMKKALLEIDANQQQSEYYFDIEAKWLIGTRREMRAFYDEKRRDILRPAEVYSRLLEKIHKLNDEELRDASVRIREEQAQRANLKP